MHKVVTDDSPLSNCLYYENCINFSVGEPHFGPDKQIIEMIYDKMLINCRYSNPRGLPELREKIIKKYNRDYNRNKDTDNVLIGAGVSNLLYMVLTSFLQKGDEVLLVEPYYFSYKIMLDYIGVEYITISEKFNEEDINAIKDKINLILFSNPSNPTGYCMSKEQLKLIDNYAKQKDIIVVSDEIYCDFVYENKFTSMAEISEDVIILFGFSKSYSMTGLRLGAAIANKDIINKMLTIQTHTLICVPESIQWGGVKALDIDISNRINYYKENRDYIYDNLKDICDIEKPSAGLYYYLNIGNSDNFIDFARKKYELLFANGKKFTDKDSSHIRMSFCVSKEMLEVNMNNIINCICENRENNSLVNLR